MACKICNNSHTNKSYEARELMLGYRDRFLYFQCSNCGCLQINEIPMNMSKYYPKEYYSYNQSPLEQFDNPVKKIVKNVRNRYAIFDKGPIGRFLYGKYPNEPLRSLSGVIGLTKDARILDVGCGSGALLYTLKESGFENLLGIDPFIEENIEYDNRLSILKKNIHELAGEWDLIMFHHTFEHLSDPLEVLQSVSRLLSPKGSCLIRTPTVSSYAWEHYGVDWVQLDAPRHFFIHSIESIKIAAKNANLQLEKTIFDSTDFQFWGSEQYRQDIPLTSKRSYLIDQRNAIFPESIIASFKCKARELNLKGQGDSAAFYLSKSPYRS